MEPLKKLPKATGHGKVTGEDLAIFYNQLVDAHNAAIERLNELEEKYEKHVHNQQRSGGDNVYRTSAPKEPTNG